MFRTLYVDKFQPFTFVFNATAIIRSGIRRDQIQTLLNSIAAGGGDYIIVVEPMTFPEAQMVQDTFYIDVTKRQFERRVIRAFTEDPAFAVKKHWFTIIGAQNMRQLFYVDVCERRVYEAAMMGMQAVTLGNLLTSDAQNMIAQNKYNTQMVPRQNFRYGWVVDGNFQKNQWANQ